MEDIISYRTWSKVILGHAFRENDRMNELQRTVAVVFNRKGKKMLSEREFINALFFELKWSDPTGTGRIEAKEAQRIMEAAIRKGLLEIVEGYVKPTFDHKSVEVPLNYKPTKDLLKELGDPGAPPSSVEALKTGKVAPVKTEVQPVFSVIIDDIAAKSGWNKREVVSRINRVMENLSIDAEVAALLIGRDAGVDAGKYLLEVKEEVLRK
ncbi:MAG: DUF2240 family protein [Methanomassiliicoccus sp.]|nr:MAG: DUF2240 family protein [Methanomassiliicoccus sp.]